MSASDHDATRAGHTPSRVGRFTRAGGMPPAYRAIPLGIAVLIGVAGLVGYRVIRESIREDLRNQLQTLLNADREALGIWARSQCRLAEAIAAAVADKARAAARVAAGEVTVEALRAAPEVAALARAAASEVERAGFEGFYLLDAAGRILAAPDAARIGSRLPPSQASLLPGVIEGEPRLLPPAPAEEGGEGPVMFVATPAARGAAGATAVLAFHVRVASEFGRILSIARLGETGETYAFDRDGRLLSDSRFETDLRKAGLLAEGRSAALNVEIRDPGGNLLEGFTTSVPLRARPLTRMAASAVAGLAGADVEGYRDYRGVPVVGAWAWLDDLNLGITTEVDVDQAYRPLRIVSVAFWTLFGAAALAALLLSLGSIIINRLQRTVADVKQLGQYTLGEKIGEGAMGRVYRATHAMLRRPTAVKLLQARDPASIERFEREVQLTAQLSHPNTIAIYDYGRTPEGVFYYAMEYLDGIDLADLIKEGGAVETARVVHILRQVCGSLIEAHGHGLVHRDIKPSNIVLTNRGGEPDVVKVVDFGLVKHVDQDGTLLTTVGVVYGTPGFIPPETLKNPATFDARGDIYAVGAVAYELLTGQGPFERTTAFELCRKHVEVDPLPPSMRLGRALPPMLSAVVMACLAKDPDARPQTAVKLRELLDACEDVGSWTRGEAEAWWEARAAGAVRCSATGIS